MVTHTSTFFRSIGSLALISFMTIKVKYYFGFYDVLDMKSFYIGSCVEFLVLIVRDFR